MIRTSFTFLAALAVAILCSAAQAGTITYFHNDLAGSPLAATNEQGLVVWRESYRPYGERLVNSPAASGNSVWFTSRRQDAESGLVYMGARHYDPVAGRFVSVDPVGFDEGNVHSFNRYAYANNNPYRYVDPDGRSPLSIFAWEVAKATGIGYGLGVAADAISQKAAFGSVDWGMAATSSAAQAGGEAGLVGGILSGLAAARTGIQVINGVGREARSAENVADSIKLNKALASQAQMGETGTTMAGAGGRVPFRDAQRVAGEHGGKASEWAKKASSPYSARDGTRFETHWAENVGTGQRVEFKTKFVGSD